jgi:hypothetical protein
VGVDRPFRDGAERGRRCVRIADLRTDRALLGRALAGVVGVVGVLRAARLADSMLIRLRLLSVPDSLAGSGNSGTDVRANAPPANGASPESKSTTEE